MFTQSPWLRCFVDDEGQDVHEYALLLAFVVLVTAALFLYNASSVSSIWTSAGSYLAAS